MHPDPHEMNELARMALIEDRTDQDLTSMATIPAGLTGRASIITKADGVMSGIDIARTVFSLVDETIEQEWQVRNGQRVRAGDLVGRFQGRIRTLLNAERTALNFLQHLSGIATATQAFVKAVSHTGCRIADTRKTTPGLRKWEKRAVVHGGGVNHRMDLASGMLIKENHIMAAGSIGEAIRACRDQSDAWLEVECETIEEVEEAVACRPDIILLDNMNPEQVRLARQRVPDGILLEASGCITRDSAGTYAETGVDRLAIGAITHSAPALDLSMRITGFQGSTVNHSP